MKNQMKTKKEKGTIKKVVSLVHKLTPGYLTLLFVITRLYLPVNSLNPVTFTLSISSQT
jgi:hypothetical protein